MVEAESKVFLIEHAKIMHCLPIYENKKLKNKKRKEKGRMIKRYFDDPEDNVAFERCIDVLAELIEKYSGLFALNDIGYEYYMIFALTPMVTSVFSFEDYRNRVCKYTACGVRAEKFGELNTTCAICQKAC